MMTKQVRLLKVGEQVGGATRQTAGMAREELASAPGVWVGISRTAPGVMGGWHHHGEQDTYAYVISGRVRIEYGPGGSELCEAGPGETAYVPCDSVHRESNPSGEEQVIFVVRVGPGDPVFNADGPGG